MKLATLDRTVSSAGVGTQQKMGMILDGTAFKILSDGLYSDKIGSLVRETYSNAVDSHIMAGQPEKPAWIQLPNGLDPTFIVRDEGIGLDEEGVMTTATTYFGSTKRSDNVAIGGFGLGFKSPFAYCDQWTILATKDGVSRMFSAYMNDLGEPQVALLATNPTDKPNGVEIRVPVKNHDLSRFRVAVETQLQFFEPRPIITGGTVSWPDKPVTLAGEGYELLQTSGATYYHFNSTWIALLGPVAFPIDKDRIEEFQGLTPRARALLKGTDGRLHFNVGEVSPAPSRESLQYNPLTMKAIADRLDKAAEDFSKEFKTTIESSPTYFEACRRYEEIRSNLSRNLSDILDRMKYKGRKLVSQFDIDTRQKDYSGLTLFPFDASDLSKTNFGLRSSLYSVCFRCTTDMVIMIDDLDSVHQRQVSRIKQWWEEQEDVPARILVIRNGASAPESLKNVFDYLGGFPEDKILKLSDLPPPEIVKAPVIVGATRTLPGVRKANRQLVPRALNGKSDVDNCSTAVTGSITPGLYVVTEHNTINSPHWVEGMIRLESFLPGDVYFVPKSISDRLVKEDGWVDFVEAFVSKVTDEKASIVAALKKKAKARSTQGVSGTMYYVGTFLDALETASVPAPARTRSHFWKLYRSYLDAAQTELSEDEEVLIRVAEAMRDEALNKIYSDTYQKFANSLKEMAQAFKKANPLFFEVLDNRRCSMDAKFAKELAEKLG